MSRSENLSAILFGDDTTATVTDDHVDYIYQYLTMAVVLLHPMVSIGHPVNLTDIDAVVPLESLRKDMQ